MAVLSFVVVAVVCYECKRLVMGFLYFASVFGTFGLAGSLFMYAGK